MVSPPNSREVLIRTPNETVSDEGAFPSDRLRGGGSVFIRSRPNATSSFNRNPEKMFSRNSFPLFSFRRSFLTSDTFFITKSGHICGALTTIRLFPMGDSPSVVSSLSDSMALWYRNVGGMAFELNSPNSTVTAGSWPHCSPPQTQDVSHVRQLPMED